MRVCTHTRAALVHHGNGLLDHLTTDLLLHKLEALGVGATVKGGPFIRARIESSLFTVINWHPIQPLNLNGN